MISPQPAHKEQTSMGTVMSHNAFGIYAEDCLDAVCREVARLESILSRYIPESDVSRINQNAGGNFVEVNPETFNILARSLELSAICDGNFDITIAPLVNLWNIGKNTFTQPSINEIKQVLELVNYRDLILDASSKKVGLSRPRQAIDLGGIGKGYTGDCILEIFRDFGVTSAYSNLGGNVVTLGAKPDGTPWNIGIQHPRLVDSLIGSLAVIDRSIVTSGSYQRFSNDSLGNQFHHIIDPATGYPVESGLVSVTIVSDNSMTADVLSTALFVMGINRGMELLMSFPKTEAILMDSEEKVFVSKGLKGLFQSNKNILYTILE